MMVASCATAPKTSAPANAPDAAQGGKPEAMGPHDVYGPPVPEMYGPDRVGLRPVILVLGPGLARGFAYVGALRALHEAKVPIGAILGTEMGSLIGALYAMKGSINSLEWALFKLKDDAFVEKRGFLTQLLTKPGDGQKLSRELDRVFGKRDLTDAKIPLRILIQSPDAPGSKLLEKGPTGTAVRASIAVPGLFSPVEWEGHEASSPAAAHPFLVSEARNLGIGPVIVVDVLDGASGESEKNPTIEQQMAQATAAGAADLKDADLVIKVDMKGIGYLDFQKRSEAAFRGKTAVAAQIPAIRHLVGLPEGSAQP